MLNFEILKNPINWIIVVLMLLIASMFFTFTCSTFSNKLVTQEA